MFCSRHHQMSINPQIENLRALWKQFDDYFRHKETLSHAIILVEMTLLASLISASIPDWYDRWYDDWTDQWQQPQGADTTCTSLSDCFLFYLPLLPFAMVVFFLVLAHRLLLMQLRMRKIADAWGDGIRLVLTKWTFERPNEADLKPLLRENLEEMFMFKAPSCRIGKLWNKYLFPTRPIFPNSNADSLWRFVPSAVTKEVYELLKDSHASQFEWIVASVSLILFGSGLAVFFLKAMAYDSWIVASISSTFIILLCFGLAVFFLRREEKKAQASSQSN
jgi:hypothetical protein